MNYDIDKVLPNFPGVGVMLEGLDRELWEIFLPEDPGRLILLELNLLSFVARAEKRERVMAMQNLCGFPLRPNASLGETMTLAYLRGKIQSKILDEFHKKRRPDSFNDEE